MNIDSPIQKHILIELLKSESGLRFTIMKPKGVENDLFNYHLQQLIKKGFVEKKENIYSLTHEGKYLVEDKNPINPLGTEASQYKVNVILLLIRNMNGTKEILVQRRKRHPFYGNVHIPGGNIRKGETMQEAAKRKCLEESGLNADFEVYGVIRKIRNINKDNLHSDVFLTLCIADNFTGKLVESNNFGENFWVDLDAAINFEQNCKVACTKLIEIYEFLKTNSYKDILPFIVEEISDMSEL